MVHLVISSINPESVYVKLGIYPKPSGLKGFEAIYSILEFSTPLSPNLPCIPLTGDDKMIWKSLIVCCRKSISLSKEIKNSIGTNKEMTIMVLFLNWSVLKNLKSMYPREIAKNK